MARIVVEPVVQLTAQALGASFNGPAVECLQFYGVSYQMVVSAAAALNVTFKAQVTNDFDRTTNLPVNWADYSAFGTQAATANGAYQISTNQVIPFKYVRMVSTNAAGTGNVNVIFAGGRVG